MNIKRKDREITDKKEIQEIIKKAKILHLGLIDCVFRLNGTACTLQREGCPLQTGSF